MTIETRAITLIRTKLQRPRLPGDLIPRQRLLDRLHAGSDSKLTLISAMAGTGKTTLLVQWLEECPQPSAWLSLDEHDNNRIVFLTYLCSAIQTAFPHACKRVLDFSRALQPPPVRVIIASIVNELDELFSSPSQEGNRSRNGARSTAPSRKGLILDAQAAQAFVEEGGVRVVGKGLNAQNYAIALPKGALALKAKLDEAITAMYNDGTSAGLVQRYLVLPQVLPTPTPAPQAPQITRFAVDPAGQIMLGECMTVRWQVQGTLDKVTLTANDRVLWEGAPASGNYQDCPSAAGTVAYGLEAVGPGGTSRGQQAINVVEPATATSVPTAAPERPVIYSLSVSPNQVEAGGCMGISWSVGGGTTYSRILRNGVTFIDERKYTDRGWPSLAVRARNAPKNLRAKALKGDCKP